VGDWGQMIEMEIGIVGGMQKYFFDHKL